MPRAAGDSSHYEWVLRRKDTGEYDDTNVIALPSVTTIIKATLASPALVPWAYRCTLEGIDHLLSSYPPGTKVSELLDHDMDVLLKESRLRPDDIRDDGATRGTDAHSFLEYLSGLPAEEALEIAEDYVKVGEDPFRLGICKWWCQARPIVVAAEVQLKSLVHGFAGTVDLVWKQGKHLSPGITDLKTRKANSRMYRDDNIQTAAYQIAWNEEHPDDLAKWRTILLAMDDGTFAEHKAEIGPESFLSLLHTYNTVGR